MRLLSKPSVTISLARLIRVRTIDFSLTILAYWLALAAEGTMSTKEAR